MKRLLAVVLTCIAMVSTGNAAFTDFVVLPDVAGGGSITGSTFTITNSLVDGGVSFDVNYSIVGSGALDIDPDGIGIAVGNDGVNNGESLTLTASITNVMNGTVMGTFDEVNFDADGNPAGDFALSGDLTPQVFNGGFGNDFFVDSFSATFTGTATAVPEPGSFAALGFLAMGLVTRRRRRSKVQLAKD
ncbi:PEP-CTERM sorting domain-containing protein [Planctomycetes bacterium K23_9]|uniref:Ice-binding protein C-terminal domain-containing protein n=1 Tax=Stieleria marina TaxID=1930275 RepID=A0A517NZ49_9BACT|nr:hypothetical protein K239x_44140 [Planctomycetes bacterium K23_9]